MYILFTVGGEAVILTGGMLGWRFIRNLVFRIAHMAACVFVALEATVGILCPLTDWEHQLREAAGQTVDRDMTFIARLIRRVVYYDFPAWVFTAVYIAFGGLVVATIFIFPPRRSTNRRNSNRRNDKPQ